MMKKLLLIALISSSLFASYVEMKKAVEEGNLVRARAITRYDATSVHPQAMFNMALFEYLLASETSALRWLKRSYEAGYNRALMGEAIILFSHSQNEYYLRMVHNTLTQLKEHDTLSDALLHVSRDLHNHTSLASAKEYEKVAGLYYNNLLIKNNIPLAKRLFEVAGAKGSARAFRKLGDIHHASGAQYSEVLAIESYKKAYELSGDREALYKMGQIYLTGTRQIRNISEGELYTKRALAGGYEPTKVSKEYTLPLKQY